MPKLTLEGYRQSDLPRDQMVVGRLGHVHDAFLGFDYEPVDELPDEPDRDLVVVMDNADVGAKLGQLGSRLGKVVFAAAPSDATLGPDQLPDGQVPANIVAGFASNCELRDGRMTCVPLGVRRESSQECKEAVRATSASRPRLLYGNFAIGAKMWPAGSYGKSHIRHRLVERFAGVPWAEIDVAAEARTSAAELSAYYANIGQHKFVLSPEGIGADCYRHWECLYLGAIPIVRSNAQLAHFTDLPILFTEDYSEIDAPYLEEQWRHFRQERFEFERAIAAFYRRRFRESVARLSRPRFLCWGFRGTPDETFLERLELVMANPRGGVNDGG